MGQEFLFAKPGSIGTINPDLPGLRYVVEDYFSFSSSEIYFGNILSAHLSFRGFVSIHN